MQITTDIAQALLATSIAIGLLLLVELVAPQDRIALTARIRAWGFWLIAIPVNVVVVTAMSRVWHGFGIRPLIVVPVDETLSGWG